jgi:cellulose synthase/poly-beta-1,6-N-acetylglucosamine synthase-like glycosyltransferase
MNLFISIIVYFTLYIGVFAIVLYILSFFGREKKKYKDIGQPFVSIIIPTYNEENSLRKTVENAVNLDYPLNKFEILIIDDGSTDSSGKIGKILAKEYKNVKYFRKENGGKGSALNYGIKKAKGDYIVTDDADSMANSDVLKLMMPHFSNPKVMAVTSAMKVYKPRTISQRIQAIEYDLGIFFRKAFANLNAINVTPGPFSIIRKSFFEKYGGYKLDTIVEDMEMAMRMQSHNYIIENELKAVVYTISPRNFFSLLKQRRRWYAGTINIWSRYKHLFSTKYGEFGAIILPLAAISVLTTMIVTIYYLSKAIIDTLTNFIHYSTIGFDFFNNMNFQLYYLVVNAYTSLSEGLLFFVLFFSIFTITLLIILNRRVGSGENPIKTFINYIMFLVTYSILYSLWWGVSILYSITGRKVKWK